MTVGGAKDLLRALGTNASPGIAQPSTASGAAATSFADALSSARAGKLASGRTVEVDPASGVNLSKSEVEALSRAADRAEANGATSALVLLGERAFKVDVPTRRVTGEVSLSDGSAVTGIDTVLRADGEGAVTTEEKLTSSFSRLAGQMANAGLRRALGEIGG